MLAEEADYPGFEERQNFPWSTSHLLRTLLHTNPRSVFAKNTWEDRARERRCRHRISTIKMTQGANAHIAFSLLWTHIAFSVSHLEFNHTLHWDIKALHPSFQPYHSLHTFLIPTAYKYSHTKFSAVSQQPTYLHLIYSLILQPATYPSLLWPSSLSLKVPPILQGFTIILFLPENFPRCPHWHSHL